MNEKKYSALVKKHTPKEDVFKNAMIAFLIGGVMGIMGQGLIDIYSYMCDISTKEASSYMIITLIFFGCLFTCLGWFDKLVNFAKCGLIIPITGFAHAVQSATLEYKREGMITGIGANMFKLAGSVIVFGVVSAYTFGLLRLLVMGG
ncbi:MAG: SpoVA/SpoVAEb family sporulation membrane protein [Bacilli bacterium]|nr:SpoVA/SpoVAEb family sporulation membrane protein [Bacilli bacterium]